uniref:Uncharacterized protein n=1 Tax=Ascaris lumbricoides TaxID=6252 RepID=A0A0M3INF3_ASCLU
MLICEYKRDRTKDVQASRSQTLYGLRICPAAAKSTRVDEGRYAKNNKHQEREENQLETEESVYGEAARPANMSRTKDVQASRSQTLYGLRICPAAAKSTQVDEGRYAKNNKHQEREENELYV